MRIRNLFVRTGSKEPTVVIDGRSITLRQALIENNEDAIRMFQVMAPIKQDDKEVVRG